MPNPYREDQDRSDRYSPYQAADHHRTSRPARSGSFLIPWWVILITFFIGAWPVSIILILLNRFLNNEAGQPPRSRYNPQKARPVYAQAAPTPASEPAAKSGTDRKPAKTAKAKASSGTRSESILLVAGIIATVLGLLILPQPVTELFAYGIPGGYASLFIEDILAGSIPLGGGIAMLYASHRLKTMRRMRKKIDNIVGSASHMYIQDIAASIPCSYEKCCDYLEDCIDNGVFGEDAYLDMRSCALVVRGRPPQPKAAPDKQPAAKPEPETGDNSRYTAILQQLRALNEAIPDDEMSDRISRLEAVSAKIFRQAEQNPDKLPQMRKFLDYYLPTSLKLLKTYAELDAQGIEGENISESKRRIEQAMGTLVSAFENQLDKLFQADALDISTDIDVMENMLRADGLTDDGSGPQLHL